MPSLRFLMHWRPARAGPCLATNPRYLWLSTKEWPLAPRHPQLHLQEPRFPDQEIVLAASVMLEPDHSPYDALKHGLLSFSWTCVIRQLRSATLPSRSPRRTTTSVHTHRSQNPEFLKFCNGSPP